MPVKDKLMEEGLQSMEWKASNLRVLIEGIVIVVFSLVSMVEGIRLIIYKDPYVLYDPLGPGPYVLALSVGLLAAGIFHYIANYRAPYSAGKPTANQGMKAQLFRSIGILALYILLLQFVGYLISTITFFFLQLRTSGVKSWTKTIILTVVLSISFYVVFVKFCEMAFPKGAFFQW